MKGTYKIMQDEVAFSKFLDWLPDLELNETYYISLLARKKYAPVLQHSKNDRAQLKRFTSTKEDLYQKIKTLETEVGNYKFKNVIAPQESLALYITPNPRCQIRATKMMAKKCIDLVCNPYNGHNIHQEALSCIQKAKSRTVFVDFDFDLKERGSQKEILKKVEDIVENPDAITVIETHGGFHVLIEPSKVKGHIFKWYNLISNLGADAVGDSLLPVVGCTQGNFIPNFYNFT